MLMRAGVPRLGHNSLPPALPVEYSRNLIKISSARVQVRPGVSSLGLAAHPRSASMNKSELNIMIANGGGSSSSNNGHHGVTLRSVSGSPTHSSHIPVAKATVKLQERIAGLRSVGGLQASVHSAGNGGAPAGKSMSVAAQRAAFERLDAASNNSTQQQPPPTSPAKLARAHSSGGGSHFGSSQSVCEVPPSGCRSPRLNRSNSFQDASKWKSKYEEAEKRRKMLLQKSEAGELLSSFIASFGIIVLWLFKFYCLLLYTLTSTVTGNSCLTHSSCDKYLPHKFSLFSSICRSSILYYYYTLES